MTFEIQKTHMHLFLAEYDFNGVLRDRGIEIDSADMGSDTGGLSRIDVWKQSSNLFEFRGHAKSTCMNISDRKFAECDSTKSGSLVGYFDFDESRYWHFIGTPSVK